MRQRLMCGEMPFGMKFRLAETFTLFVIEILHQNTQRMKISLYVQSPSLLSRNREERERREFACSATIYDCGGQFIKWGVEAPVPNPYMSILMFQFVTNILCSTKIQTNMNWSCRFHKFANPHLSAKLGRKEVDGRNATANAERIVIKEEGGMTSKRFLDKCGTYFFCHINMPLSERQCWD